MEQKECNSAGKDPLYMKLVMTPGQQPSTSSSSSQDSGNGVQKEGTVFKVQFNFLPFLQIDHCLRLTVSFFFFSKCTYDTSQASLKRYFLDIFLKYISE